MRTCGIDFHFEQAGGAIHDLFDGGHAVEVEALHHAKAGAQRGRNERQVRVVAPTMVNLGRLS